MSLLQLETEYERCAPSGALTRYRHQPGAELWKFAPGRPTFVVPALEPQLVDLAELLYGRVQLARPELPALPESPAKGWKRKGADSRDTSLSREKPPGKKQALDLSSQPASSTSKDQARSSSLVSQAQAFKAQRSASKGSAGKGALVEQSSEKHGAIPRDPARKTDLGATSKGHQLPPPPVQLSDREKRRLQADAANAAAETPKPSEAAAKRRKTKRGGIKNKKKMAAKAAKAAKAASSKA